VKIIDGWVLLSLVVGFCLVGILAVVDWGQVINLLVAFINLLVAFINLLVAFINLLIVAPFAMSMV
jgi:hypothetical protein